MTMPTDTLFLARDRESGMHSFVRLVRNGELNSPVYRFSIEMVNSLMLARDPEMLIRAARCFGPMYHDESDLAGRIMTAEEAVLETGKRLMPSDSKALLEECKFDPYNVVSDDGGLARTESGRIARAASDRAVECCDYCIESPDFTYGSHRYRLVIEPVQDWIFLRNLLSIVLRIGGTICRSLRADGAETILEECGFSKVERKTLSSRLAIDSPGYTIPVMFNPFFRGGNVFINDLTFDANATWPLYSRLVEPNSRHLGLVNIGALKGQPSIKFVSGPQAERAKGSFAPVSDRPDESKWVYMVLEDDGTSSQYDLANKLINALDGLMCRPRLVYQDQPMQEILSQPHDLPSALWDLVRNHPNHYLMTCDNCKRTLFSTTQGPNRRFCSDSCRVTWGKKHQA